MCRPLRDGLIEDSDINPDFPTVTLGFGRLVSRASWNGERQVKATVEIDGKDARWSSFSRLETETGPITIEGLAEGKFAEPGQELIEMPRARRSGALEGEPLAGRLTTGEPGRFTVELSVMFGMSPTTGGA